MTLIFRKFGENTIWPFMTLIFWKFTLFWPFMTFMKLFFVFLQLPSSTTCMRSWIVKTKLFVTSSSGFFGWPPSYGSCPIIHSQTMRNSWNISSAKPKRPSMMEHQKSRRGRHQSWRWRSSPRRRRRIEKSHLLTSFENYFWTFSIWLN